VGHAVFFQGRVEETTGWYAALRQSARRRGNGQHMGWALALQGRALLMAGSASEAVPLLEEARLRLQPLADQMSIAMCEGLLASAYRAAGRMAELDEVAAALEARLRGPVLPLAPCLHAYLAAAELAFFRWDQALAPAAEAARAARTAARRLDRFARLFPLARPAALAVRAAIARRLGDRIRSDRLQAQALRRADELGLSPPPSLI